MLDPMDPWLIVAILLVVVLLVGQLAVRRRRDLQRASALVARQRSEADRRATAHAAEAADHALLLDLLATGVLRLGSDRRIGEAKVMSTVNC